MQPTTMHAVDMLSNQLRRAMEGYAASSEKAASDVLAIVLCLRGEAEVDEDKAREMSLEFLRSWWEAGRSRQLLEDLTNGVSEDVVSSQMVGTEAARRDYEQWLAWMFEAHPGLGKPR